MQTLVPIPYSRLFRARPRKAAKPNYDKIADEEIKNITIFTRLMSRSVIKFSSEDCGICHKMSHYDRKVVEELGLEFIDVKMQDTQMYRQYRQVLLAQYPDKSQMGWPTYIICDQPDGEFVIIGEVKGGHPKGEFRNRLQEVLNSTASADN